MKLRHIPAVVALVSAIAIFPVVASSAATLATANNVSAGGIATAASVATKAQAAQSETLATAPNGAFTATCPGSTTALSGTYNRGANSSGTFGTVPATGVVFGTAAYNGPAAGGGTITPGSTPCTTSGGTIPFALKSCSTWALQTIGASTSGVHPPSAPGAGQVTPVHLANVCVDVFMGVSNSCHFRLTGRLPGTYRNDGAAGMLTTVPTVNPPLLFVSNVSNPASGCFGGYIKNGQGWTIVGSFVVNATNPSQNPVWLNA